MINKNYLNNKKINESRVFFLKLYIYFFGNSYIFPFFKYFFIDRILPNEKIKKFIKKLKPDIVLYPTNAYEPLVSEVPKLCKSLNSKSFFLIDNWDNLSSKSILLNKPDYLAVWGEQTKKHATRIQNINSKRVFSIGTPRYDKFFYYKNYKLKPHYKREIKR